jgi:hypothetical protein
MKAWLVASVSCLLGVAAGVGTAVWDFADTRRDFDALRTQADWRATDWQSPSGSEGGGRAKLQVEGSQEFDFGVMARGDSGSHAFGVKNVGTAPLVLSVLETTCLCTDVELPAEPIKPGQAADIIIHWEARGADVDFRHSATLETSDPAQRTLVLSIHGQVRQIVRAVPSEVTFNDMLPHKEVHEQFVVYGYLDHKLDIIQHELLHEETDDYLEIETRPLSEEELSAEAGATSGVMVTVTAKPGLPLGPINQRVRLYFQDLALAPLDVAIKGNVVGDISVYGATLRNTRTVSNLIDFGPVPRERGARAKLYVVVKGPHRGDVKLSPKEILPDDVLKVSVGEPEDSGAYVKIPLTVEIPVGSRSVNHLGSQQGKLGRILLNTNHPEAPTVKLYVSFAVGDFG